MMTHTGIAGDVILFLLETLLQSAIICLLVMATIRAFDIQHPGLRVRLWLLVLVGPVVGPLIFHLLLPRSGVQPEAKLLETWLATPAAWLETHQLLATFIVTSIFVALFSLDALRWLVCGLRGTSKRRVTETADAQAARCALLLPAAGRRVGMRPLPALVLAHRSNIGAYALRWPRPHICLMKGLVEKLDDAELEAMLAHEVAHLRRRDWLRLLIAQLCRDLMFYNPMAYLAYARFLQATEEATDDAAAVTTHERLALAACLIKTQRVSRGTLPMSSGLGLVHLPAGTARRAARLLRAASSSACPTAHLRIGWALMALAVLLAALI